MRGTAEERFLSKIEIAESGCWLWTDHIKANGYGQFRLDVETTTSAHRAAYHLFVGPIPEGMHIDHLCRVRHCANPDHLEAVTPAENIRRGLTGQNNAIKTHCPQGHPYSGSNVRVRPTGQRECRECDNGRRRRKTALKNSARPGASSGSTEPLTREKSNA